MSTPIVVQVITLGCAKNLVDAEVMCGTLAANGILLTTDAAAANLILINTCSFIRDARKEADEAIRSALKWKKQGQRAGLSRAVAVAGCLPQRNPQECAARYPDVDFFLGLDDVPRVHELIHAFYDGTSPLPLPSAELPGYLYDHQTPRITVTPENYAYIKIAEGCNHRCAFCAIPNIRGKLRSRQPDSVLAECEQLLAQGVREINFIAQDCTSYGKDSGGSLVQLLKRCEQLPGDFWLRVLYTHPLHVTEEFLELLAHGKHLVPYLDMPLQHASSSILLKMRRGMDGTQTRKLLEHIRKDFPEIAIRTTFLTGFPGETDQDFQELLSLVKEFCFERLGVFAFSPEDNTPALSLPDEKVPSSTANRRRNALLKAQQSISLARNQALIGQTLQVLPDEKLQGRLFIGRSAADAPEVDQFIQFQGLPGRRQDMRFAKVRITACGPYELEGVEVG
ncbi:MAG: 30S ribosomal protein S12 methylthiotransferase RimO, partial [Lentisphaerae bacterium]|jgi:ribosomal protein S12 methylthiotransferase|nr:30S ribosomal protein S12 methylthiotransferase RimO [Lentisphaerota bacterium]